MLDDVLARSAPVKYLLESLRLVRCLWCCLLPACCPLSGVEMGHDHGARCDQRVIQNTGRKMPACHWTAPRRLSVPLNTPPNAPPPPPSTTTPPSNRHRHQGRLRRRAQLLPRHRVRQAGRRRLLARLRGELSSLSSPFPSLSSLPSSPLSLLPRSLHALWLSVASGRSFGPRIAAFSLRSLLRSAFPSTLTTHNAPPRHQHQHHPHRHRHHQQQPTATTANQVILCHNRLEHRREVELAVAHELVHAYDFCRAADLDLTDCRHHACTEVRSARVCGVLGAGAGGGG